MTSPYEHSNRLPHASVPAVKGIEAKACQSTVPCASQIRTRKVRTRFSGGVPAGGIREGPSSYTSPFSFCLTLGGRGRKEYKRTRGQQRAEKLLRYNEASPPTLPENKQGNKGWRGNACTNVQETCQKSFQRYLQ